MVTGQAPARPPGDGSDSRDGGRPQGPPTRREAFSAAHPHVHIAAKEPGRPWQAFWLDSDSRPRTCSHPEEDRFLDLLEARFGAPS